MKQNEREGGGGGGQRHTRKNERQKEKRELCGDSDELMLNVLRCHLTY